MALIPFTRKFSPEAKKLIKRLPPEVKSHIRALTDKLRENPHEGKALQKELKGYYSIKHQRYRVIYEINEDKQYIIIEYVGLRENIYEVFHHLLKSGKHE